MKTIDLVNYINDLLSIYNIKDFAPNGLQVEGSAEVKTIVTGVSASQELLRKAIEMQADAVLVHHGFFFKGEAPVITGMKRQRIAMLLQNNINLLAYHLPLDVDQSLGNNVMLAKELDINIDGTFAVSPWDCAGSYGHLTQEQTLDDFAVYLEERLQRKPLYIAGHNRPIKTIAWATGAAEDYIIQAGELGVDAFITGEASERTCHYARELGINFFAAGHHATERYGVRELGRHLASKFDIKQTFVDIDNPI